MSLVARRILVTSSCRHSSSHHLSKIRMVARPLVLCGPSGVGKSTIIARITKEFPDAFGFSVSHTTRSPREGEVDGVNYFFTDREAMQKAIDDGEFIEHAVFSGNMYGTSKTAVQSVMDQGKICILDIVSYSSLFTKYLPSSKLSRVACFEIHLATEILIEFQKFTKNSRCFPHITCCKYWRHWIVKWSISSILGHARCQANQGNGS